jgi:hypothetical protein
MLAVLPLNRYLVIGESATAKCSEDRPKDIIDYIAKAANSKVLILGVRSAGTT